MAKLDENTTLALMHIRATVTDDMVVRYKWINEYDLFVEFSDGKKYYYDGFIGSNRLIPYTENNLSQEEWNFEFRMRLKQQIERRFINQENLAEKLHSTQAMISRYINGDVIPTPYRIYQLACAIGCEYKDLIFDWSIIGGEEGWDK